jgi:hypothetical protein
MDPLWIRWPGRSTLDDTLDRHGPPLGSPPPRRADEGGRAAIDVDKPEDLALVRSLTSKA